MKKIITIFITVCCCVSAATAQIYTQKYRPQFHFSPVSGWIGDPTGAIRFQDTYRLFWWGQATSDDLVFWDDKGWAMAGDDGSFIYFTGSVVVDADNTSGFGTPADTAMVAVYTMHNKATGIQSQGISTSLDYDKFQYYSSNPVIPSTSTDFRDPQVIWHQETGRWVMVITRPVERAIEIYTSANLVDWTYASKFEKEGAQKEVWEVPDLFRLPLDGDSSNQKWVMTCGMGPNRTQYWVGDFDGTHFTMDSVSEAYLRHGAGIAGVLFEDWENGYNGWTATGNAFGAAPAQGAIGSQQEVTGYFGNFLVNTFLNGDVSTGTLTSPAFQINHPFINFLISGGSLFFNTEIQLVVNGQVARRTQGYNSERLRWDGWDVSDLMGQSATIVIVDNTTSNWGHINVDNIYFSDVKFATKTEHAYWADWGTDFYAAKSFKDYDHVEESVVWLAWMNNWAYANRITTAWGNSTAHSLPRELRLVSSLSQGYKLIQTPIPALQKLRQDYVSLGSVTVQNALPLTQFQPSRNTYEMETTFKVNPGSGQDFGLNLCVKGAKKLVLGYDEKTSEVYLNRTSANDIFIPNFNTEMRMPVVRDSQLTFHIFVDQLSVEVFVNGGEYVMTALVFPAEDALGIELFSKNAATTLMGLKAWELQSIWGVNPTTPSGEILGFKNEVAIFPNPVHAGESIQMQWPAGHQNPVDVTVFSVDGKVVFQQKKWSGNRLPVHFGPGTYFLQIQSEKFKMVKPLVVK